MLKIITQLQLSKHFYNNMYVSVAGVNLGKKGHRRKPEN